MPYKSKPTKSPPLFAGAVVAILWNTRFLWLHFGKDQGALAAYVTTHVCSYFQSSEALGQLVEKLKLKSR